tara:strand:- start:120 stop:1178 length:1059 start_codon:yes stop_codon:yes gene_type:complete
MIVTEPTVLAPSITAKLNRTGWVAVDLGYLSDPVAFTPQAIADEKARLPDWMWQKEYERNFRAQVGKPVFRPDRLQWQEQHLCDPLLRLTWNSQAKTLRRTEKGMPGNVQVWIHPDSQPPTKPKHMERVIRSFAMGIDVGEGVGQTDSAIVGIVGDTKEQAFEFKSNRISPTELGQLAAALGRMFNVALILCVRKMHGLTTIREIVDVQGYGMVWHEKVLDQITQISTDRLGWRGAEASDENLFGPYRKAIDEQLLTIHSTEWKFQLTQYVFDDMGRIVHQALADEPMQVRQRHGDVAVAGGLAWRAACDLPLFVTEVPVDDAPYGSLNWRNEQIAERDRTDSRKEERRWRK